jgi:hypothetical protein
MGESTVKVHLADIPQLVPSTKTARTHGDRELDGAPLIDCKVTLRVAPDHGSILADVYFKVQETKGDYTMAEETWTKEVYTAKKGTKIVAIESPTVCHVHFRGKAGGFQFLAPTYDWAGPLELIGMMAAAAVAAWDGDPATVSVIAKLAEAAGGIKSGGNFIQVITPKERAAVSAFAIVGDTGGDDISDDSNPKDDTRIERIKLAPATIRLKAA